MKTLAKTQFSILAVISLVVTGLTFYTGTMLKNFWHESIDGKAALPDITLLAIQHGHLVPLACCLASIFCVVISTKKPDDLTLLWRSFTLIVTIELISQTLIALFYLYPILNTHTLM